MVTNKWSIRQLDINNVFLQVTLIENVYMYQPPSFINLKKSNCVCKLHKAVYGFKQAPYTWYTELHNYLTAYGFTNSLFEPYLFINHNLPHLYALFYVDDIFVTIPIPLILSRSLNTFLIDSLLTILSLSLSLTLSWN